MHTLCFPDGEKSCFACCPPIRPSGYEHIRFRGITERILRENTASFSPDSKAVSPITGFSCWALGYLDRRHRVIGCMLHPSQNNGVDFRYRIDYGEKCGREVCPQAREFLLLGIRQRIFWLRLCEGMDSFSYSSPKENPLFTLLGWGSGLLCRIASEWEPQTDHDSFLLQYPFFRTALHPAGHAYLLEQTIIQGGTGLLKSESFRIAFEEFAYGLSADLGFEPGDQRDSVYTHLLELPPSFLNFLRGPAGFRKMEKKKAHEVKEIIDNRIAGFRERLHPDPFSTPGGNPPCA